MNNAVPRPVGRTLAALAVEVDALAAEIDGRELTDLDIEFLAAAHQHLHIAAEALDAALLRSYSEIERHLDRLELAA